ncbi:MAG: biotin--[acetyl-CoA-carboxylase] ligase [Desulfofustis sp.]|nr:biotin--[acetyl-CoA-carboxylase] ligase [Desulfofustis sp.]RZW20581.1 MAG: biotin--[acetyl-CoA-carboxylase] ligase [Desulfobulbaceae bacterium]
MASCPSPEELTNYLKRKELPARLERWQEDQARLILLYGAFVGSVIEHHQTLDRTMPHARAHVEAQEKKSVSVVNGTVFLADTLSDSKGRFTRVWHAPPGGLWGSVIYISTLLPGYRMMTPLAVGVACCEAMQANGASGASIRWINDVLIGGRKVGGFLAENFSGPISGEDYCLLGFGINLNNEEFPDYLGEIATSLSLETGRRVDLERFTTCFLAKLSWNIGLLYWWEAQELARLYEEEEKDEHPLISRWKELSDTLGRKVLFGFDVQKEPQYEAIVKGITNDGGLRLELADGSETVEHSGEIRYLA